MLASKNPQESEGNGDERSRLSHMGYKEQLEKLFDKLDLSGIEDWSDEDQEEVQNLIQEFSSLFALMTPL